MYADDPLGVELDQNLYALDSTTIDLCLSLFPWARFRRHKAAVNVIERCFVEVRRRTRPVVCFVNVESVDRIIYSIFQRFNLEWKTRTLNLFKQAA